MTILDTCDPAIDRGRIALVERHAAHNYSPLPVVAASAEGAWITDVDGRRYLDCLAAYSAVNFGHRNPEITATAHAQLDTVTLVSRAFHSDQSRAVLRRTCPAVRQRHGAADEFAAPRRSRAASRSPASGVPTSRASPQARPTSSWRTTTFTAARSASSASPPIPTARDGFGPFTPGFRSVPFGDADGTGPGDRRQHRRGAARADPGRGRHHRSARRLPARGARAVQRAQRADDRRRNPVRAGPNRATRSPATAGA